MGKMTKKQLMARLVARYPNAESIVINKDGNFEVTEIDLNREYISTYSIDNGRPRLLGVTECEI